MGNKFYQLNAAGEYELVGCEFTGFPSNGLWFVEDGKQNCIHPMGEKPLRPSPALASYMVLQDELQQELTKVWKDKTLSVSDISKIACEFFALRAGAIQIGDEIIEN